MKPTLRQAMVAVATASALLLPASVAAADVTRQCDAEWRFTPQNPGMTFVTYSFAVRRTVDLLAQVNRARREARARILDCTRDHWAERGIDSAPRLCRDAYRYDMVNYPFGALESEVTAALCGANPGHGSLLISVELFIGGDTGCTDGGGRDRFLLASNHRIDCAPPIGEGGADEVHHDDPPPIGEGGGWECVGEGCDAAGGAEPAPGADSPPATARYIPLPGVRLPGNDLYVLELAAPNWMLCRQACTDDENCGAWTYRAPNAGSGPLCLIKSRAGLPIPDACCRSGIRQ